MSAVLQVEGLTRRFGGLVAVDGLAFAVASGEIVGLVGPNGAGKSTVLDLLSGVLRPDTGSIVFLDRPIAGLASDRIAKLGLGRTFQPARPLVSLTCHDNVLASLAFGRKRLWGRAARDEADRLLDRVGLGRALEMLPGKLAYIDHKRLELARALALQPELLLLDEWLAGLNPAELEGGIALIKSLNEQGMAILLVEHNVEATHGLCHRCLVMSTGRLIASGLPAEVLAEPEVTRAYVGEDGDA